MTMLNRSTPTALPSAALTETEIEFVLLDAALRIRGAASERVRFDLRERANT